MDYSGQDATALYKYQWDLIHNPQRVWFAWLKDEEEGEASLPCVGWFDDCDDVLKILEKIRIARINNKNIRIKGQSKNDEMVLSANFVKVGNTDYSRIRLIYRPKNTDYIFNPLKYDYYDQEFISNNGSDRQFGFVYYDESMQEVLKILIDETNKRDDLEKYLFGEEYDEILKILTNNPVLTAVQIKNVREQIALLKNEELRKELYLNLQEKVPYHNQRNNNQPQSIADRMCNLTSEAMCLEYLGISCPNPNIQFEDYLEQIRENNNYGDRTTQGARQKVAEKLGACFSNETYGGTFSTEKEELKKFILSKLQSGCAVMMSVWPVCMGHLVRVQNITNEGIIVDDPYGKVTDFKIRQDCKSGGYDLNSKTEENSKGNDNLWRWEDIEDITVKYVEVYCKCK